MDVVHLPFELWNIIFDHLHLKQQIRFIQICKIIKNKIFITDLCNIGKLKIKLTGDIIKKYPYIKKLYTNRQIGDDDLVLTFGELNLVELNTCCNSKIKKINHMTNLRKLSASGFYCGIGDEDLVGLNLIELNARNNEKIKKVNHMTNLRKLNASWFCGIKNESLVPTFGEDCGKLNLIYLNAGYNPEINKINHMTNLRILHAEGSFCGIDDNSLVGLNLIELNAWDNPKISKINHMTNLRKLNASCRCGITDDAIVGLNLLELKADDNPKITKKIG